MAVITGASGNDSLVGTADADRTNGDAGSDILIGGPGVDSIVGGVDNDTAGYPGSAAVSQNLNTAAAQSGGTAWNAATSDTLSGIENVTGDGNANVPTGSDGLGGGGNDTFDDPSSPTSVLRTITCDETEGIICFTPDARIETDSGWMTVGRLREGDRVMTRDNGFQEIRWIGSRDLDLQQLQADESLRPVLVKAGSLAENLPEFDLTVSPAHRMLVTSRRAHLYFEEPEVFIAAEYLVGLPGVLRGGAQPVRYIHFMFDRHEVVRANGAWAESFLPVDQALAAVDCKQREAVFKLFPDLAARRSDLDKHSPGQFIAARRVLSQHEAGVLLAVATDWN